jgi:Cu(I)/Ag(I) efflux system protein CusF
VRPRPDDVSLIRRASVSLNQPSEKEISMKKATLSRPLVLALLLPAFAAFAQQKMDDMKGADMGKEPAAGAPMAHVATGTVKKVDATARLVTFAHEPVKSMNWPAMTMGFQVKDKMLLDKLAVGKKVDFEFVQEAKGYVVTSVK